MSHPIEDHKPPNEAREEEDELLKFRRENAELKAQNSQLKEKLAKLEADKNKLKQLILRDFQEKNCFLDLPCELQEEADEILLDTICHKKVSWCDLPQNMKDDFEVVCLALEKQQN